MNTNLIERQFAKMGARAKVRADLRRNARTGVSIDVGRDADGEFFDIAIEAVSHQLSAVSKTPLIAEC